MTAMDGHLTWLVPLIMDCCFHLIQQRPGLSLLDTGIFLQPYIPSPCERVQKQQNQ